ncbi:MAG: hypothetical protein QNJ54_34820 [Prochloraceae cyanobacterium]|nr:hypothetical protein [Prochloraceae cyanobacterium]
MTLYDRTRGIEQFVLTASQLTIITSSYPASAKLPQAEVVTAQRISSKVTGV